MSCLSLSFVPSLLFSLSLVLPLSRPSFLFFSLPDIPRLPAIERKELFNVVFDTTAYRAPPNIQLPEDYQSPALAISKLYWKGWLLLLVLSAFNPKTIGMLFAGGKIGGSCCRSRLSNHSYFLSSFYLSLSLPPPPSSLLPSSSSTPSRCPWLVRVPHPAWYDGDGDDQYLYFPLLHDAGYK